jgi:hypothetical protein
MTPEERRLISGLFDRMRNFSAPEKDREADALINQSMRANADAPYMLVQSVLVQEQALEAANARIQDLEDRLREFEDRREPRSGGGFLSGGLFGGRQDEGPRTASVPQIGARSTPSAFGSRESGSRDEPPPSPQPPPASSGGGFMRSALATAAGVAGGVLIADTLRNMLGGGAHASQNPGAADSKSPLAGPDSGEDAAGRGHFDKAGHADDDDDDDDDDPGFDTDDIEV